MHALLLYKANWLCPTCTFSNQPISSLCEICTAPRPITPTPTVVSPPMPTAAAMVPIHNTAHNKTMHHLAQNPFHTPSPTQNPFSTQTPSPTPKPTPTPGNVPSMSIPNFGSLNIGFLPLPPAPQPTNNKPEVVITPEVFPNPRPNYDVLMLP